ncbi:MAG: HEAT repeat domain-containing protein [Dermatophilaceae bacterium]
MPGQRDALAEVLLGLKHPHESVRQRAALALGSLVTPDLAGRLAARLWEEPDPFVRETLTWVLARVPGAALPYAVAALTDPRAGVRHTAAHLVGKIGDPSAVGAVIALTADVDDEVAAKARFVLSRLGDPAAIPALTAHLGRGGDERRTELTRDLASFGPAAVSHLTALLEHPDAAVRDHARWVLEVIEESHRPGEERNHLTLTRRQRPGSGA